MNEYGFGYLNNPHVKKFNIWHRINKNKSLRLISIPYCKKTRLVKVVGWDHTDTFLSWS